MVIGPILLHHYNHSFVTTTLKEETRTGTLPGTPCRVHETLCTSWLLRCCWLCPCVEMMMHHPWYSFALITGPVHLNENICCLLSHEQDYTFHVTILDTNMSKVRPRQWMVYVECHNGSVNVAARVLVVTLRFWSTFWFLTVLQLKKWPCSSGKESESINNWSVP